MDNNEVLKVSGIVKHFPVSNRKIRNEKNSTVKAVDGVSFSVRKGETFGIVGESGCGKTTLGKCIMRLYKPSSGQMLFNVNDEMQNSLTLDRQESFSLKRKVQMIFQDPYASFNPMRNILSAFDEPLKIHGFGNALQRKEIVAEMLKAVNIQPDYIYRYPHEFSGGQRQRICIAKALAMNPEMIVCDEPVSALDVSIQAQILNLMRKLQREFNLSYLFIAHDLSVVQYMSNRIAVMYLGKIVEMADTDDLYNNHLHPYTQALLSAVPIPIYGRQRKRILLTGDVPSPIDLPTGCRFHPRCVNCMDICKEIEPDLCSTNNTGHMVACHLYKQEMS